MVITNRKQPLPAAEFMDKCRDILFFLSEVKKTQTLYLNLPKVCLSYTLQSHVIELLSWDFFH